MADLYGTTLHAPSGRVLAEPPSVTTPRGLVSVSSPVLERLRNPISLLALALIAAPVWLVMITRTGDARCRGA